MFGQVIIGPPGSGKSTFCNAMAQFLTALERKVVVCNLDPANEYFPYECHIDVRQLIDAREVAENLGLGPNGSLIYCLEFLDVNFEWFLTKLANCQTIQKSLAGNEKDSPTYVLIDFPGQVELYTHKQCLRNIMKKLEKAGHRLVTVHLVDVHYCTDASKFISVLLTSLTTMLRLETPHLNLLSKLDLFSKFEDKLPFDINFFTDVLDLKHLLDLIDDDPFMKKFKNLNQILCETIEDYGLVSFMPLNIQDKFSMAAVLREADKANGFCFHELEERQLAELDQLIAEEKEKLKNCPKS